MDDKLPFKECKKHGVLEDKDKKQKKTRGKIYYDCRLCHKEVRKNWEINNKEKIINYRIKRSKKQALYYSKWKEKNREKIRNYSKKYCTQLYNYYIKRLIIGKRNILISDISEEIVEIYKDLLLFKRELKEIKHGKNNRQ